MDKEEVKSRIKGMLVEDLFVADSPDEISDDAKLGTELGLDSVGFVELATMVGEVFEIKVDNTDIGQGHFASVEILTAFVLDRVKQKATA